MITSVKDIIDLPPTAYKGSEKNYKQIADAIEKRWGKKERSKYSALTNCRTYISWLKLNRKVIEGERALQCITLIEKKNAAGKVIAKYPRVVNLFYYLQTEPITK